jgi:hypothetical protein
MASSSAAGATLSIGCPVTEKLTKNNYPLWKAQVMSALHGAQVAPQLRRTSAGEGDSQVR